MIESKNFGGTNKGLQLKGSSTLETSETLESKGQDLTIRKLPSDGAFFVGLHVKQWWFALPVIFYNWSYALFP